MSRHLRLQRTMRNPGRQKHRARKQTARQAQLADAVAPGYRDKRYFAHMMPASALLDIWRHRPR